jgi:phosphoenolpyruvate carboxylase
VDRARGLEGAQKVDTGLGALSLDDTLSFVRGFMLFSMLANLAEDRQGAGGDTGASVAEAVAELEQHGIGRDQVMAMLRHAHIAPVLTAHPTEVRRKSMIDHKNRIADLMGLRDAKRAETDDGEPVEEAILPPDRAVVADAPVLRRERLYVAGRDRQRRFPISAMSSCPCCPRSMRGGSGCWATRPPSFSASIDKLDRRRSRRQPLRHGRIQLRSGATPARLRRRRWRYYLDAVHALGAELSISTEHAARRAEGGARACAQASGDDQRRAASRRTLSSRALRHLRPAFCHATRH